MSLLPGPALRAVSLALKLWRTEKRLRGTGENCLQLATPSFGLPHLLNAMAVHRLQYTCNPPRRERRLGCTCGNIDARVCRGTMVIKFGEQLRGMYRRFSYGHHCFLSSLPNRRLTSFHHVPFSWQAFQDWSNGCLEKGCKSKCSMVHDVFTLAVSIELASW